jgi:hypothetical protein
VVSISSSRDYLSQLMHSVEKDAFRIARDSGGEIVDSFVEID